MAESDQSGVPLILENREENVGARVDQQEANISQRKNSKGNHKVIFCILGNFFDFQTQITAFAQKILFVIVVRYNQGCSKTCFK